MINEYPWNLLHYDDAIYHSISVNPKRLSDIVLIHLDTCLYPEINLVDVYCVSTEEATQLDITDKITRENMRPWLSCDASLFDFTAGFHMYKFNFKDTVTSDTIPLYFSYVVQDDSPDKSYIYMNRDSSSTTVCECCKS